MPDAMPALVDAAGDVSAKAKPTPEAERRDVEALIRAVLDRWVAAQTQGDFATYAQLYDQKHFRGVKRTKGGNVARLDWAGWNADRARMFEKGRMTVAAEEVTIQTWLDRGATLRPGVCEARFVQRWRNARYADHGVKVLQFLRHSSGVAILYEDLLTSTPGWASTPQADADGAPSPDLDNLPVPKDDQEAMSHWTKLSITEANVHDVTSALTGTAAALPMAEALLRMGQFLCKRYADYDECGQSRIEWEIIPPQTTFEDPCVARKAALWAIETLTKERLPGLTDTLVALAGMKPPEEEIPDALAKRLVDMPDDLRLRVATAMIANRCDKEGCGEWQPALVFPDLSPKSRITVYQNAKFPIAAREAAIVLVDLSNKPGLLVDVYGDKTLSTQMREKLAPTLFRQKPAVIERALRAGAEDSDCSFAMRAIEELAERGKKDLLPKASDEDPERTICLLLNASDQERAEKEFRKLLPKRGKVLFEEESTDELDGEGGHKKTDRDKILVSQMSLASLPKELGQHTGTVETYTFGHLEKVWMSFNSEGKLDAVFKTSWSGCPC
jgi:hypothetical protein